MSHRRFRPGEPYPSPSATEPDLRYASHADVARLAAELSADPEFRAWHEPSQIRELHFRGTQRRGVRGVKVLQSYTPLASAATIYSMRPGDPFAHARERRAPCLLPTSTVHPVFVRSTRPFRADGLVLSLGDVMRALRYGEPDGMTDEDVAKTLNYLHNRIVGRAAGGDFEYEFRDEDGEEIDTDLGDLLRGRTRFVVLKEDVLDARDAAEALALADQLHADAFIFFDAPGVKRAAARLGYDAFAYADPFGADEAAVSLFGKETSELRGIDEEWGLGERTAVIETVRPFADAQVWPVVPGGVSAHTFRLGLPESPSGSRGRRR